MSKNNIIIALIVLCLVGTIWGSVQNKKSSNLERQLVAMRNQGPAASATDEAATTEAKAAANSALEEITNSSLAEIEQLKTQNIKLLKKVATLKGNVASQMDEIASLKKEVVESDGSQAIEVMQAQLDSQSSAITTLEEAVVAAKAELDQKNMELAVAAEATAGFEELKSTLANSVDAYSAKSQELAADVEEYSLRMAALDRALEERTKLLVGAGEELARTKLNMNVLLSRIGAQNNSLEILEETRVVLEKELAMKVMMIEDLQQQLSGQVIEEIVVVGEVEGKAPAELEVVVVEEAPQAEEAADEAEEAPAK